MTIEDDRSRLSGPALIAVVALAAFGALVMVQWVFSWLFGLAKFVLFLVVVAAVAYAVVSAKSNRDHKSNRDQ